MNDVIGFFVLLGSVFVALGSLGVLKFKPLLPRVHALSKAATFGQLFLLGALAMWLASLEAVIKITLTALFLCASVPLSAHFIGNTYLRSDSKAAEK